MQRVQQVTKFPCSVKVTTHPLGYLTLLTCNLFVFQTDLLGRTGRIRIDENGLRSDITLDVKRIPPNQVK